jgi:hypothetical protein
MAKKFSLRRAFAPINPNIVVLATQAADQAALLAVMVQAQTALERIVSNDQDALERSTTREGFGSLMRALNGEMECQVHALIRNTAALRDSVLEEAGEW